MGAALTVGAGILQAGSQISAGNAQSAYQRAQARSVLREAELNESATDRQVRYDTQAASEQIDAVRRQGRQDFGSALAAMAAGGMSTMSGSAHDIIASSARSEDRDVANIQLQNARSGYEKRLQARLKTYDAQGQAVGYRAAAKSAKRTGYISAFATLLGTAAQVYGMKHQPKATNTEDQLAKNIRKYQTENAPWASFGGGIY